MVYITALDVSTNDKEEQELAGKGFTKINVNLNEGAQAANSIFLWYLKGDKLPVTRVQVTYKKEMEVGLKNFIQIKKNLNTGTVGEPIYMWYSKATGDYDVPIVDVNVTTNAASEVNHLTTRGVWEEVGCNLNLGAGGNFVYAWVRREKPSYICDVTVTNTYDQAQALFSNGYTRVDVSTNLNAMGGADVFIWYRKNIDEEKSLSNLNISSSSQQYEDIKKQDYELINIDLNENTSGNAVYLWHKTMPNLDKVRGLVFLLNKHAVEAYKLAGVKVIERSLNTGNRGATIYLCYV